MNTEEHEELERLAKIVDTLEHQVAALGKWALFMDKFRGTHYWHTQNLEKDLDNLRDQLRKTLEKDDGKLTIG